MQAADAAAPGSLSVANVGQADTGRRVAPDASAHRSHYRTFLQQSRAQRLKAKRGSVDPSTDTNLGMKASAGLGIGDPKLVIKNEPLWLADSNMPAACTPFKGLSCEAAAVAAPYPVRTPTVH